MTTPRLIAHLDLDCFYAQVEHRRLGIAASEPLVVQQWQGFIAVNYAARALGIKRFDQPPVARRKCPELHMIHVETINDKGSNNERDAHLHDRRSGKVSLERYRLASAQVFDVLMSVPGVTCEKASIDEAYVDLTDVVDKALATKSLGENGSEGEGVGEGGGSDGDEGLGMAMQDAAGYGHGGQSGDAALRTRRRLREAARVLAGIRERIKVEAGYTMSGKNRCSCSVATASCS
jgi:nucleotidyltransferase/DNA polymerase involved in DNA repair